MTTPPSVPRDEPGESVVSFRFVVPDTMPAEFVTHFHLHDMGPAQGAYQLTLHRLEFPIGPRPTDSAPEEVQATCVARVVLSDDGLRALIRLIDRVAGERLGLLVTDRRDSGELPIAEKER